MVFRRPPNLSESIKVLTALCTFWAKPSLVTGARASGSLLETALVLAHQPPPSLQTLNAELGTLADTVFDQMRDRLPDSAEILFDQMLEAAAIEGFELVEQDLSAPAVVEVMLNRLTDPEHQNPAMQDLFRQIATPALERILADKDLIAEITPEILKTILDRLTSLDNKVTAILDSKAAPDLPPFLLKYLASQFDQDHGASNSDQLVVFLEAKAADFRAMQARLKELEAADGRLANIIGAVEAALAAGDFDGADDRLRDAEEIQLAEKTLDPVRQQSRFRAERGQAALLKGDIPGAADRFEEAAAMLAPFAAEEAGQVLYDAGVQFYQHGLRYGGPGLSAALPLYAASQTHWPRATHPEKWGWAENARANALATQGTRTEGAAGATLLAEAVTAYRAAQEVRTREDHPVQWAMTQNNLAIALQTQGTRTEGASGATLLAEAVTAYRAALEVRTREDHPVQWAMTQNNLAIALRTQGTRTEGAAGATLLAEAVTAYRAALEVRTREDHPVDWAGTQNNLANALRNQGTRTEGAAGATLLAEAVTAYRAALEVYTREDHPVDWAMTQNNLAIALRNQGTRTEGAAGATLLAEAVTAYRAALEVYTREDHPVDWAMTQNNLAIALRNQGTRTEGAAGATLLAEAVTAYRAALEVRTREDHPVQWAMTQENLGEASEALAEKEPDAAREHLSRALACFDLALEVFDPEHMPFNHQKATEGRAHIAARLAALS